jgi:hypothetical protein
MLSTINIGKNVRLFSLSHLKAVESFAANLVVVKSGME